MTTSSSYPSPAHQFRPGVRVRLLDGSTGKIVWRGERFLWHTVGVRLDGDGDVVHLRWRTLRVANDPQG